MATKPGVTVGASAGPTPPPPGANRRAPTSRDAELKQVPLILVPFTAPAGLDLASLITTLLKAQSDAQLA
jgi:hypothetical protein